MAKNLSHTKWMCKYHIVFTLKYRRKIIYTKYKTSVVEILRDLCKWKGVEIVQGNARIGSCASVARNRPCKIASRIASVNNS